MMPNDEGPFVAIAVLCQDVLRRDDGTMDVLGIVEGLLVDPPPQGEDDPLGLRPAAIVSLRLMVSLRAGTLRGAQAVQVVGRYPAGNAGPSTGVQVEFTDERPAATINVPLEIQVHEPGTYRFDVLVGGALVTVVPLRVLFTTHATM
jgi:hypothetical protein